MLYAAFTAKLPIRSISTNAKTAITSTLKLGSDDELRELYQINTAGDTEKARIFAQSALRNLAKFTVSRPIAQHTKQAFQRFQTWRSRPGARSRLAIDSGCGCGQSTATLARLLPDVDVVGVDRSVARLSRNAAFRNDPSRQMDNALFLRAELIDFWRLCLIEQCRPDYHFLLYPNPNPKHTDMKRRWHGHPVFPTLVALGGRLEVRASWRGYLSEFRDAYKSIQQCAPNNPQVGDVEELNGGELHHKPLTNFEAKYLRVGHKVHRLVIDARDPATRHYPHEEELWI